MVWTRQTRKNEVASAATKKENILHEVRKAKTSEDEDEEVCRRGW